MLLCVALFVFVVVCLRVHALGVFAVVWFADIVVVVGQPAACGELRVCRAREEGFGVPALWPRGCGDKRGLEYGVRARVLRKSGEQTGENGFHEYLEEYWYCMFLQKSLKISGSLRENVI